MQIHKYSHRQINYTEQRQRLLKSETPCSFLFYFILHHSTNLFHVSTQIGWLVDWCLTARQHKIGHCVPFCQGGVPNMAVDDSQRVIYTQLKSDRYQQWQRLATATATAMIRERSPAFDVPAAEYWNTLPRKIQLCYDTSSNCHQRGNLSIQCNIPADQTLITTDTRWRLNAVLLLFQAVGRVGHLTSNPFSMSFDSSIKFSYLHNTLESFIAITRIIAPVTK